MCAIRQTPGHGRRNTRRSISGVQHERRIPNPHRTRGVDATADLRSVSARVLAVLASAAMLRWAAPVFITLMLGLLTTYALSPLIAWLERRRVSRWGSAAAVLSGLALGICATCYALAGGASDLLDELPVAAQKLRQALHPERLASGGPLASVQQAAAQLEQVAQPAPAAQPQQKGVMRVALEPAHFSVREYLWSGTVGLLSLLGQLTTVAFLAFFALGMGQGFRHKLVKISGPSLQKKKITVQVLDEIRAQIERYLRMQILVSLLVGVATGLAFWAVGMDHVLVWAVFAALTNLIPYVGAIVMLALSSLLAFMQFDSLQMALVVGGISLGIHTLVGNLLLPWLTQRTGRMNPVAVLVSLIFWGWMWGVWGLLLGVPMMMVVKAVCDRVDDFKGVGELLGN